LPSLSLISTQDCPLNSSRSRPSPPAEASGVGACWGAGTGAATAGSGSLAATGGATCSFGSSRGGAGTGAGSGLTCFCAGGGSRVPLVEHAREDDEHDGEEDGVGARSALAALRERDAVVAQIEIDLAGDVTLVERTQYGFRIGLEQLGVAAHHATNESRPGEPVELLGLEGLDLPYAVLEALRDVGYRELALGA